MANLATGVVSLDSDLVRKEWLRQGLIQATSKSFWAPYSGMSKDSIIYQKNTSSAGTGHTVIFDMDGNIAGKARKNKETAVGTGEQKRKFSDKITVDRYRLVVDNGDKFDAVNIGDLSISEHGDSRSKLADLFIRFKDQMIFDVTQGFTPGQAPSHSIQLDISANKFSYSDLVNIEKTLRTGMGYKTGTFGSNNNAPQRSPLKPYVLDDGRSVWLMVVDPSTAANMRSNLGAGGIMALASTADIRGNGNRVFKGLVGRIGQLLIVESEVFFGDNATGKDFNDSSIEIAGMRQYDSTQSKWTGETGFAVPRYSRNLILGGSAVQMAFGKQPDYMFQPSIDFKIKSESAVEFWTNTKKVHLKAESEDYKQAKIANMDFGVIALDTKLV